MSFPKPPTDLNGHCSVVHESTLYVYSPDAFQSIDLKEGGEWKELSSGLGATGAQCVKAVPADNPENAALFVVGGIPTDTSITNYPGIQKFSFKDQKWEWIQAIDADNVTKNRLNHGATYLNSTSQILVYAGSQIAGDTGPSSATFLISTNPPYNIQAFSSNAPPSIAPILLPWNESHAVVLGGNEDNKQIYTFGPADGWQKFGVDLMDGITQETMQTTVVAGDDGSKVLEVFNMGVSPNEVTRVVLLGKGGQLAPFGQTVGPPRRNTKSKRLEVDDWPDYNATFAPTVTRTGFSVATAPNGYAIVSGGNNEDPLCIFDQRENSWVNATALLAGSRVDASDTPTTTDVSSATASPTSSAIVEAPAVDSGSGSKDRMLTVLGATLGTIFGIAAILVLILVLLRWRGEKRKRAQGDDYIEKDRLSFADRGAADLMSNIPAGPRDGPKPWQQHSINGSNSSLAIITGKVGTGHKRGNGPFGSDASTAGLTANKGPIGYNDPVEMSRIKEVSIGNETLEKEIGPPGLAPLPSQSQPSAQKGQSRSSGWSRYFAGNEATNLANMQSQRSTYNSDRLSANSDSKYTDSRVNSQPLQSIAPLDVKFENQRISRVATGSPSMGHSQEDLHGQKAQLARAGSLHGSVSSMGDHDQRTETWSPIPAPGWQDRPSSSAYTDSNRGSALPIQDGASSFFHSEDSSSHHKTVRPRDTQDTISALYSNKPNAQEGRESTVTVFPRGIPSMQPTTSHRDDQNKQNDMSWLNLGVSH